MEPRAAGAADAETAPPAGPQDLGGGPVALYVTAPNGGTRHLLPPGEIARIGRGADCTVAIDDPRVSRSHAAVRPTAPFAVTDLGSANGTFVGRRRLTPGQAQTVAEGETFFVGDSALVLRSSGLAAPAAERVLTLERLLDHLSAGAADPTPPAGTVLLRVRATRAADDRWIPRILGELLAGPRDWLMHLLGPGVVLGIGASARADAAALERQALSRLGGWSITATADSSFVPAGTPGDLVATLYHLLGIHPHRELLDSLSRPHLVIPKGEVLEELIA